MRGSSHGTTFRYPLELCRRAMRMAAGEYNPTEPFSSCPGRVKTLDVRLASASSSPLVKDLMAIQLSGR
ncbi:hypothetical protein [Streptomyces sp. NRRL B-1677]|uniref:hypothetical protein n=1 Tax=Streptomyces sp. NRRL B-1677 TaxID=2682966 RepID=UPI001E52C8B1|nr:hypothetical protein [Streptomyces sp. NRRL B-1677]